MTNAQNRITEATSMFAKLFPDRQVMSHLLRSDFDFVNNRPIYDVAFRKDTPSVNEVMLNNDDVFIALQVGFFLTKTLNGRLAEKKMFTYVDKRLYAPIMPAGLTTEDALTGIYLNGKIQYEQASTTKVEHIDLSQMLTVPRTQFVASVQENSTDFKTDGYADLRPALYVVGNALPKCVLSFQLDPAALIAGDTTNKVGGVVIHRGILIKGAASDFVRKMNEAKTKDLIAKSNIRHVLK